jgi:hypothetical protein
VTARSLLLFALLPGRAKVTPATKPGATPTIEPPAA